jgi:hypothetical protein
LREGGDAGAAANYLCEIAKAEAELAVIDLKFGSPQEWDAWIGKGMTAVEADPTDSPPQAHG